MTGRPPGGPPVWDIPTRLFHWLLVAAIGAAWWSAEYARYDVHEWAGYTVIVLVLTRVAWGFIGSRHSRFTDFVASPRRVLDYLRGKYVPGPGHNPLGGWSVLALLALVLLQAVSGLFNSDAVLFSGPLHYWASTGLRGTMGTIHEIAFDLLLALICLHIAAVLFHQVLRREKLIQAMLRGWAEGRVGREAPVPWWWAVLAVLLVSVLFWWGLQLAPKPVFIAW